MSNKSVKVDETPKPPPRKASFGDLKKARMTVVIHQIDGEEIAVDMTMLSRWRINELRATILPPAPPVIDMRKRGDIVENVYGYSDPTYLMALSACEIRRNYLVLLHMLPEGFVPGDSETEQLDFMQTEMDAALTDQLFGAIGGVLGGDKARIIARAESF